MTRSGVGTDLSEILSRWMSTPMKRICADSSSRMTSSFRAMNRDLYYLGKVLDRKYHLLYLALQPLLFGFIGAVVGFLVVQFL